MKISNKKAFSLIELSIAIVIIAILVAAVTAGDHLVRNSRVSAARSITLSSQILTIPGMVAWYEPTMKESFAVQQSIDGAQISSWYNREPSNFLEKNNLSVFASDAVTYKEKAINNLPAVRFDSGSISISNFYEGAIDQPVTIAVVFRPTAAVTSTNQVIFDSGISNPVFAFSVHDDAASVWAPTESSLASSFVISRAYIAITVFNDTSSAIYINDTTALSGFLNPGTGSMDGITIGSNRIGGSFFSGDIAEVIIFDRNLKTSEIYDVFNYLSKKYNIAVTGL